MGPVVTHARPQRQWPVRPGFGRTRQPWPSTKSNGRGLPSCLRAGMEAITGVNLQRVRVHYDSQKPAEVSAHGYARGLDIYLAPGQAHHLPHELGHVVQQQLGLVQPTMEVNGIPVNDDAELEKQATELGKQAVRIGCRANSK